MFRVIRPRNAFRLFGRSGGMAFQAASHVSFTLSSASSAFRRRLYATVWQYGP